MERCVVSNEIDNTFTVLNAYLCAVQKTAEETKG
jgi:hypothetical protein